MLAVMAHYWVRLLAVVGQLQWKERRHVVQDLWKWI
jgi:hypothetical protein